MCQLSIADMWKVVFCLWSPSCLIIHVSFLYIKVVIKLITRMYRNREGCRNTHQESKPLQKGLYPTFISNAHNSQEKGTGDMETSQVSMDKCHLIWTRCHEPGKGNNCNLHINFPQSFLTRTSGSGAAKTVWYFLAVYRNTIWCGMLCCMVGSTELNGSNSSATISEPSETTLYNNLYKGKALIVWTSFGSNEEMTLVRKSYQRWKWTPSLTAKSPLKIIRAGIFLVQPIPLQSVQSISAHKHRWKDIEFLRHWCIVLYRSSSNFCVLQLCC